MISKIRIAIADDQLLFRKGLASLLNSFKGIELLYEASNGMALLELIEQGTVKPDIVMLDLNMPVLNGIDTTKKIRQLYPDVRIIILSVYNEEKFIIRMLELGINGYLFKESEPDELERSIHAVMEHDFYMNDHVVKAMRNGISGKKEKVSLSSSVALTLRESEILDLICREYTTPEIADKLSISERTVEGHRNNLLHKTGARNSAGLVIYAIRHNLYDVNP